MLEIIHEENYAIIELNNQPVNAINSELLNELSVQLETLNKILIIKGKGKHFSAGADIKEMKDFDFKKGKNFSNFGKETFCKLLDYPMPVIASINGACLGGGLELALHCDILIASKSAKFGFPEITLGLIPGFGGTIKLPTIVSRNLAKELIWTGKIIDSETAYKIGLLNEVVDDNELVSKTKQIALELANKDVKILHLAKMALNGKSHESELFGKCFATEIPKKMISEFLSRK